MGLNDLLAGISGGIKGGMEGYSYMREAAQKDKQIEQQAEIARMRAEIQEAIARLNAGSREKVAGTNADSREKVAGIGADSRERVAGTKEEGLNTRAKDHQSYLYDKLFTDDETKVRGQDVTSRDRRYATDTGASTTRRGQDITASTSRRGQDLTAGTAARGQDLNFSLGTDRNELTGRGQDLHAGQAAVAETGRNSRAKLRSPYDNIFAPQGGEATAPPQGDVNLPAPTPPPAPFVPRAAPQAAAPAAPARAPLPVTPRAGAAPGAPQSEAHAALQAAAANPMAVLTAQATLLFQQWRQTTDPKQKAALGEQLKALKAQREALIARPTGGTR